MTAQTYLFLAAAFASGLLIAALVAVFIARSAIRRRSSLAAELARTQAEASFKAEEARLGAELQIATQMLEESRARTKEAMERQETRHKEEMAAQQGRFDETMKNVSVQVKAATEDVLKERQKEFAESNNTSIGQIVDPLKENIVQLRKALEEGNKEQAERSGEMRQHIRDLMERSDAARKSADDLAAAFKHGTKVQGDWGETILEELLSSQGLTEGIHYDVQPVIMDAGGHPVHNADGGIMRPDVILHLDRKRDVIIDSKVSLTAYVDYVNAEGEEARQAALRAHIDSIRKHVKELAVKDYSAYVQAPKVSAGYVIMFVPNVGALWTALNAEPDLWRKAADQNVCIVDEQTLYGALKVVNMTWTRVAQEQNHEKVYSLASEMIDRVGQFMERYDALGRALGKAQDEFEGGLKKLSPQGQSIVNTAGKLIRLGARNSDRHPVKELGDAETGILPE